MKERQGCIYELRCLVGERKGYVGQTCEPETRWKHHINMMEWGSELALHRAMRKYGVDNFSAEIIWRGPCSKLNAMEIKFIKKLVTFGLHGYNMTMGGEGSRGWKPSSKTKARIARAQRGKKHTAEACANMRAAQIGRRHSAKTLAKMSSSQKGHIVSESTREKIRAALSGRIYGPHSAAHKSSISKALKGRKFTPEWCAKLSAAKKGKVPWNKGKKTGIEPKNKGKKFVGGVYR